jgi:hypothetical protein
MGRHIAAVALATNPSRPLYYRAIGGDGNDNLSRKSRMWLSPQNEEIFVICECSSLNSRPSSDSLLKPSEQRAQGKARTKMGYIRDIEHESVPDVELHPEQTTTAQTNTARYLSQPCSKAQRVMGMQLIAMRVPRVDAFSALHERIYRIDQSRTPRILGGVTDDFGPAADQQGEFEVIHQ